MIPQGLRNDPESIWRLRNPTPRENPDFLMASRDCKLILARGSDGGAHRSGDAGRAEIDPSALYIKDTTSTSPGMYMSQYLKPVFEKVVRARSTYRSTDSYYRRI